MAPMRDGSVICSRMSLPDVVGLTHPCSGPKPRSFLTRKREPFFSTCSKKQNFLKRPTSSDCSFSPSRTRHEDAVTHHNRPSSTMDLHSTPNLMLRLLYSAHAGYRLLSSPFHFARMVSVGSFICFSLICLSSAFSLSLRSLYFPVRSSSLTRRSRYSAPAVRPSSSPIFAWSSAALSLKDESVHTLRIASPSSLLFSFPSFVVPIPHPPSCTDFALHSWSAKTGVMIVGVPAPSEPCVVPMPPWCTQHEH
mmetsp:Transcript_26212/g.71227  ORF Transcript_26212/g.71227 Transcript_26212/m.71227 type:complete len:251 (+) Transcript_26212:312-1064(+)